MVIKMCGRERKKERGIGRKGEKRDIAQKLHVYE